ncbi:MAG: phosphoribosyltransferase [Candidatus Bathyarchaeota archaeon]|nr:phosphoribosyltransferase [Candidatus Bathyarchaeota archaeon]
MPVEKVFCEYLSWDRFLVISEKTAEKMNLAKYRPDFIVSLARGGWVFGRVLCDYLNVSDLVSLKVEHWGMTATPDGEAKIKYPIDIDLTGRKVLIVDDISDTGKSLKVATEYIRKMNPADIKTTTLFYLTGSSFMPDFYGLEMKWRWVVFPWNWVEDMCNLVAKVSDDDPAPVTIQTRMKDTFSINISRTQIDKTLKEIKRRKK